MELYTDGLLIRPWRMDDAAALAVACDDPEIARWIPMIPTPYTEDDARAFLEQTLAAWEAGEVYNFAILDAESGAVLGSVGMRAGRFHVGHFGYWVARDARGRGLTGSGRARRLDRERFGEAGDALDQQMRHQDTPGECVDRLWRGGAPSGECRLAI